MKRRRARRSAALIVLGLLGLGGAPAAGQTGAPLQVEHVDTSSPPRVRLTVTAPRELVGEQLGSEHFTVTEDGIRRPVDVSRLPTDALEVVLVIDTSGSMQGEPMDAAKAAAVDFVRAMPPEARIAVVGFGDAPVTAARFGTPPDGLVAAVEALTATGETALYDALVSGAGQFAGSPNPRARRFVVLLSDGGDTASTRTLDQAVATLGEFDVGFFAVALATSETDLGALAALAKVSDGKVVAASEPSEIAAVYDGVASQLVNQYEVAYASQTEGATNVELSLAAGGVEAGWSETLDLPLFPENATPAPASAEPYTAPPPGLLSSERMLLLGVVPFALALAVGTWLVVVSQTPRRRLVREFGRAAGRASEPSLLQGMAGRATAMAERVLADRERSSRLDTVLEQAGLAVRPAEFVVLVGAVSLAAGTAMLLVAGPLVAVVVAVVAPLGAAGVVSTMRRRRQRKLADQLGDTLQLLSGSLRAGHGLVQALDMVTSEAESPTAEEFHRVIVEARLGRDLSEALDGLAGRAGNEDFEWVVQAIRIHREVGGDLAEILDRVGETIRDRNRVRGHVRSLTAEGRLSAIILMALPFLVGGWMWMTNRPYVEELTSRSQGRMLLLVGTVLMTIGAAVMKRLVRPEF